MNKLGYERVPDEDERADIDELRVDNAAFEHAYLQAVRDGRSKKEMELLACQLKMAYLALVRAEEIEEKHTHDADELRGRLQYAERKFKELDARVRHKRWRLPRERDFVHAARDAWLNVIGRYRQALKLD